MAGSSIDGRLTRLAGENLTAAQYHIVKLSSGEIVKASAATDKLLGILENAPADGDNAVVVLRNSADTTKVILGSGGCSADDKLTADSSGHAVATTSAGNQVVGIALEAGDANDIIEVMPVYDLVD